MKRILIISLLALSMTSVACYARPNEESLDKMVAIVNDDVISRNELNHALDSAKAQIAQEHAAQPSANMLQKQVLDQLINKKIQLQIAKQAGIQTNNTEVNKAIERIANQNHISTSMLYEHINQDGMSTEEYRSEIRDQMTMQKLQQQEVASKITITPQEITNFTRSHAWQENTAKEYHLQDILVPVSDTPSTDEINRAKDHANEVMAKIKQGQTFDQVAQAEIGNKDAIQGGDLGWRKLPEIPSAFAEHVIKMQSKSVAGPIQTPNGFHIIRLNEARLLSSKDAATSQKMVESLLLQQKFEEAVQTWVSKLRGQAFVVLKT